MATIKPIDSGTIHRIQSGQVIVDLCSVAKELIENSVDAGASSIDVRFKNQGLDSIEVQDNGSGISPDNYGSVALKHYTSKLSSYDDISNLQTFGFRGEALSSLCALSQLSIVTCQSTDVPKGTKLKFAQSGALEDRSVTPAKQGTTVIVESLFHNLPVRRRELERHIKRDWTKIIALLNQYACILTGVKFTVSQQPSKGKKIVLFSTKGNPTTRDNVINVFGAKTMTALIPLDLTLVMEPSSSVPRPQPRRGTSNEDQDQGASNVSIKGHVSRPAHGEGRQAPDRQMFFVNGRPCGLPQLAKVFNEVYRAFNNSQSPFIFADIQLDTHMYDVNVSPDKRTIMLHEQGRMLENLRVALNALFEKQDYKVPAAQLGSQRLPPTAKPKLASTPIIGRTTGAASMSSSPELDTDRAHHGDKATAAENEASDSDAAEGDESHSKHRSLAKFMSGTSATPNLLDEWVQRKSSNKFDETPQSVAAGTKNVEAKEAREASPDPYDDMYAATPIRSAPLSAAQDRPVEDFHARLTEMNGGSKAAESLRDSGARELGERQDDEEEDGDISDDENQTSSLPHRLQPEGHSVRKSLERSAPEAATITIGSHTVTSVMGTPAKRHRDDLASSSLPDKSKTKVRRPEKRTMPSFGNRLSQMFSATAPSESNSVELELDAEPVESEEESSEPGAEEYYEEPCKGAASPRPSVDAENVAGPDPEQRRRDLADTSGENTSVAEFSVGAPLESAADSGGNVGSSKDVSVGGAEEPPQPRQKSVPIPAEARQTSMMKGATKKKDTTLQYEQHLRISQVSLRSRVALWRASVAVAQCYDVPGEAPGLEKEAEPKDAEEKLSLTISKGDFGRMKIVGQFNLGFVLAVRPGNVNVKAEASSTCRDDELFIIDQHASDEKYNFERLQASTVVQSQRLVHPKTLVLTALEEEIVIENLAALETNGFKVVVDESGNQPVGSRCQLLALPLSKETTFTLADLEELISLLGESYATSETAAAAVPRPTKVRKMFAMRACRSSVMIGHALQQRQMERLVRHMGELDKPWNCPHGRPTMRHLTSLRSWDEQRWRGDGGRALTGLRTTWDEYLGGKGG